MSVTKINYTVDDTAPLRFTIGYDSRGGDIDARTFSGILQEWKRLGYEEACISTNEVFAVFYNQSGNLGVSGLFFDYPANRQIVDNMPFSYNDPIWRGGLTGTVAYTLGSKTVTGTGTSFNTQAQVGMILRESVTDAILGVVASITNNTTLTLVDNCPLATASGITLETRPVYTQAPYIPANMFHIQATTVQTENYVKLNPETKRDAVIVRIDDMLTYPFRVIDIPLLQYCPNYPTTTTKKDTMYMVQCHGSFVVTPLLPYSGLGVAK